MSWFRRTRGSPLTGDEAVAAAVRAKQKEGWTFASDEDEARKLGQNVWWVVGHAFDASEKVWLVTYTCGLVQTTEPSVRASKVNPRSGRVSVVTVI
jgi:hypothetical protein